MAVYFATTSRCELVRSSTNEPNLTKGIKFFNMTQLQEGKFLKAWEGIGYRVDA